MDKVSDALSSGDKWVIRHRLKGCTSKELGSWLRKRTGSPFSTADKETKIARLIEMAVDGKTITDCRGKKWAVRS